MTRSGAVSGWPQLLSPLMTEILDYPRGRSGSSVLKLIQIPGAVASSALALLPVALWCLTHQYHGLVGDSELYAVQALARNDPSLDVQPAALRLTHCASRATAAEIRRRSEVLRPVEEPDWRLLTRQATHGAKFDARALPLTKDRLVQICADPALGFVVAKEDVGLGSRMRHD